MNSKETTLIALTLPVTEVELILAALAEMPYKHSAPLVDKLTRETIAQLNAQAAVPEAVEAEEPQPPAKNNSAQRVLNA